MAPQLCCGAMSKFLAQMINQFLEESKIQINEITILIT